MTAHRPLTRREARVVLDSRELRWPAETITEAEAIASDDRRRAARPDEITRRLGAPEIGLAWHSHDRRADPGHPALGSARLIVWIILALFFAAGFALGWLLDGNDGTALLDLIAPTAAQAREIGWVALSEGL